MGTNDQGPGPAGGLQFDKVDLAADQSRACKRCNTLIHDEYFESAGNILCRRCAEQLGATSGGGLDFWRALAYGAGAAVLGTILWFIIMKVLNSELGIVAIAVGLVVGLAVRKGSLGRGGARYQALAMALTYVSITSSYVPFVIQGMAEDDPKEDVIKQGDQPGEPPADKASPTASEKKEPVSAAQLAIFVVMVFGLAFAAPFLGGASNIMGILIIGIALYEAWKINRHVPISGPFRIGAAARAGPVALIPPTSP
jgi:hypothetical protein